MTKTPVTAAQAHLALSSDTFSTLTVAKKSPVLILPVGTRIFREAALERATLSRSTSTFSTAVSVGRLTTRLHDLRGDPQSLEGSLRPTPAAEARQEAAAEARRTGLAGSPP